MTKTIFSLLTLAVLTSLSMPAQAAYELDYIGEEKIYVARDEDTLVVIARENEMGFVEMRAANPTVDPWLPGAGTELILPKKIILPDAPHEGVVINLPEMRLFIFDKDGSAPTTFPISIGREGLETPIGTTTVVRKADGPVWRPTPRMRREDPDLPAVVEQGPENPMGTHALYLGWPSYALHGTNKPYGIGRRASSGCIRLYPEHITKLFSMIPVGTKVTAVNQPIKLAWIDDVLYLEAHPDIDQAIQMEETGQVFAAKMSDQDMAFIVNAAGQYQDRLHWATVRNEVRNRSGRPVMIARRPGAQIDTFRPEVIDGAQIPAKFSQKIPDDEIAQEVVLKPIEDAIEEIEVIEEIEESRAEPLKEIYVRERSVSSSDVAQNDDEAAMKRAPNP